MKALSINRLVNVSVNLAPKSAQMQNISTLLILGSSSVIDSVERYREYTSIEDVTADFSTTSPEYLAAVLWFEQAPQPVSLQIGLWAKNAIAGALRGATLSAAQQSIAAWNAVTSGSFAVVENGTPLSVTGLNFSTATNLNGVASTIQTALAILSAGSTVVWNANYQRFEFTSGTTGATSSVNSLELPTATGAYSFAGQPANNDTITLNGTVVTFVTGTPVGPQVQISAVDLPGTLVNLLTFLQSSTDTQLVKFKYFVVGSALYVEAVATGTAGNALTTVKSGTNISVTGATLAGGSGTDISTMLAATATSSGAYVAAGLAAETALAATTLFDQNYGQNWYGLVIAGASNSDHLAVAPYIEASASKHLYGVTTMEAGVLSSVSSTDVAYLLKQLAFKRTAVQFSSSNAYAVCSLLGRILTTNYNGNNTVITLMYKQEPGIVPENLNVTQMSALEGKNCNVFVAYNNNTAIVEPGMVSSGEFVDTITGTDWLALDIQTSIYNLLYTTTTKIPQTDAGNHMLVTTIEGVCSQGVTNGLLAPGTWNTGGFGALNSGDFLPKGFYVFAPPIALQNPADRSARKSVPIQVAAKLAGAIHSVDVIINVNR
jgi:hypothetical protein